MAARDYGQYCGVTRALEIVGERWALLIVRDLLVAFTSRFTPRAGEIAIDGGVLGFTLGVSLLTGLSAVFLKGFKEAIAGRVRNTKYFDHIIRNVMIGAGTARVTPEWS